MPRILLMLAVLALAAPTQAKPARVSDKDIVDAYHYMIARWVTLRQEGSDFRGNFKWNQIFHRDLMSDVVRAYPYLEAAYSEAWLYTDETSCTQIELPKITGRYYSVQVMNLWGEVVANINDRTYPKHSFGKYTLCTKGTKLYLPPDTQRVDLPGRKSRLVMRIELGADPAQTVALQNQVSMKATGEPIPEELPIVLDFPYDRMPAVDAFDHTAEILGSDPDINPGMSSVQKKALAVARAATDPTERARIDEVITKQAVPAFFAERPKLRPAQNGWFHPLSLGNYGSDYLTRSIAVLTGLWPNVSREVMYFRAVSLDGGKTFTQTWPKNALPTQKALFFWSVTAVKAKEHKVLANPINRYQLQKHSDMKYNPDGSLTIAYGPGAPSGFPESNWLPTVAGQKYDLMWRFYGPTKDVIDGKFYPPPLVAK